jgi:dihydrofolate reductase
MSTSVLRMSMSLDGYIAGPNDEPGNPGGDGFDRLHEWYGDFSRPSGPTGVLFDEMDAPGAVLAGRRTVEQIDHWGGDSKGRPIFVPSHRPPDPSVANYPLVTYVTDGIDSAMAQAKAAAGDGDVTVLGAYTAQRALEAGVLDELQIHQIPVLFGGGRRMFDVLPLADRTGDRPGDRHPGRHPHPLPRPPLSPVDGRPAVSRGRGGPLRGPVPAGRGGALRRRSGRRRPVRRRWRARRRAPTGAGAGRRRPGVSA